MNIVSIDNDASNQSLLLLLSNDQIGCSSRALRNFRSSRASGKSRRQMASGLLLRRTVLKLSTAISCNDGRQVASRGVFGWTDKTTQVTFRVGDDYSLSLFAMSVCLSSCLRLCFRVLSLSFL